jgi:hypothetical protein
MVSYASFKGEEMTGNSTSARTVTRVAALLEGLVFFVPVFVLGAAIEWPASLDFEPPKLLRLVAENESMTQLGYVVYLIYSLAFWPVIALFGWHALSRPEMDPFRHHRLDRSGSLSRDAVHRHSEVALPHARLGRPFRRCFCLQ